MARWPALEHNLRACRRVLGRAPKVDRPLWGEEPCVLPLNVRGIEVLISVDRFDQCEVGYYTVAIENIVVAVALARDKAAVDKTFGDRFRLLRKRFKCVGMVLNKRELAKEKHMRAARRRSNNRKRSRSPPGA